MSITTDKALESGFIDDLTAMALNDPRETREPTPWEERLTANKSDDGDVPGAYVTGLHDGSIAVAHRWVESHAASAIRYWAGPDGIKRLREDLEIRSASHGDRACVASLARMETLIKRTRKALAYGKRTDGSDDNLAEEMKAEVTTLLASVAIAVAKERTAAASQG